MISNRLLIILIFVISSGVIFAHGKHKKKSLQDTVTMVGNDTIAINGKPVTRAELKKAAILKREELAKEANHDEGKKEVTFSKLFEHLHNKLIHFPIALSVGAFLLILFGYKDERMIKAVKILVPFAALMAVISVITGISQSKVFEGEEFFNLVEVHRTLGLATSVSLILWSISLFVKKTKKYSIIFAIITLLLVTITAFYGGIIAH